MSNVVMLKRAFNQAVATGAVRFTDKETDFLVIKRYIIDYAAKYNVDIPLSEIDSVIRKQQENLVDISTKLSGEASTKKVENVAITNKPPQMTKEEMLKVAFEDAAANAAVHFTDKVADFLVIRNSMAEYAKAHGQAFTLEEIEKYIRKQEKLWSDAVTNVVVTDQNVSSLHVSDSYKAETLTKEKVLSEGFEEAASNGAVRFTDPDIDFLVIKKIMLEYAARWNMAVTEAEVAAYIKEQFRKLNDMAKDFNYEI